MSMTNTITYLSTQTHYSSLQLPLISSLKEKKDSLVKKLKETFGSPFYQALPINEQITSIEKLDDFKTDESKEQIATAFALFITKYLDPLIEEEINEKQQVQLLDLEDKIKQFLPHLLPVKTNVKIFIEETAQFHHEWIILEANRRKINQCFYNQMQELSQVAQLTHQNLKEAFEHLKKRLKEINQNRKTLHQNLYERLETLSSKVNQALKQLEGYALNAEKLADRMQNEQAHFRHIIQECENTLKNI